MTKNDNLRDDNIFLSNVLRTICNDCEEILSLLDEKNTLLSEFKLILK